MYIKSFQTVKTLKVHDFWYTFYILIFDIFLYTFYKLEKNIIEIRTEMYFQLW